MCTQEYDTRIIYVLSIKPMTFKFTKQNKNVELDCFSSGRHKIGLKI